MPSPATTPTPPNRFLLTAAALGLGSLLGLLALEICLQIYNPFFSRIKGNRIVLQANKKIQFHNDIIQGLEKDITVVRNSLGFRGPEPPADLSSHLTLLTVGGSTTQCFMVSEDKTWTALLAQRLAGNFDKLWVNNAGLDGHSTFGHLVLLEDHIRKLHPKTVLFLVGANDVARGQASVFDAENVRGSISGNGIRGMVKSLSAYSEVIALGLNFYRSFTAYQAGLLDQRMDFSKLGTREVLEVRQNQLVAAASPPDLLAAYQGRLQRLVQLCREAGIEPMFITQPILWGRGIDEVTGVDLEKVKLGEGNGTTALRIQETYNGVTRTVCKANNLRCLDIANEIPKSRNNFYDNVHYTVEGNRAVSQAVYQHLCPILAEKFPSYATSPCP